MTTAIVRGMNRFRFLPVVAALVLALIGASVAAANPVEAQYNKPSITKPQVKGKESTVTNSKKTTSSTTNTAQNTSPAATTAPSSGTLPFTGLNLGIFLIVGGVAVASGFGLRRIASRRTLDR